jgi:hypothetical protein
MASLDWGWISPEAARPTLLGQERAGAARREGNERGTRCVFIARTS